MLLQPSGLLLVSPKKSRWDQAAVIPETPMMQIIMNAPAMMQEVKHNHDL